MSSMQSGVRRHIPNSPLSQAILLALADRARHGYAIRKEVERLSDGALQPRTGTLYAALRRMETDGLIREVSPPDREDEDPRRRYFEVTGLGTAVAQAESARLLRSLLAAKRKHLLDGLDLRALIEGG